MDPPLWGVLGKEQAERGGGPAITQVSKAAADPFLRSVLHPSTHSSGPTKANPTNKDFPNEKPRLSHQEAGDIREEHGRDLARNLTARGNRQMETPQLEKQLAARFRVAKGQPWQTLVDPLLSYLVCRTGQNISRVPIDKLGVTCRSVLTSAETRHRGGHRAYG